MASASTITALSPGTRLDNRYTIRSLIASGGFGITYVAEHDGLGRTVAIKEHFPHQFVIRDGATASVHPTDPVTFKWALDRFLEEGRALARSKHPNVVDVTDVFEGNGTAYIVLSYEDGESLGRWARRLGRPPAQRELDELLRPLLDALQSVHRQGLLHRDIAPDNIMVRRDGSPCLIDFGAARQAIAQRSVLMSAIVKGGYSPPEQYSTSAKAQGPWSDIYALAATLYRIMTGRTPPEATERVLDDELRPLAEALANPQAYRPGFLAAIDHALRIRHSERPQSVAQWREELFEPGSRSVPRRQAQASPSLQGTGTVILPRRAVEFDELAVDSGTRIAAAVPPPSPPPDAEAPSQPPASRPGWLAGAVIAAGCLLIGMSAMALVRPEFVTGSAGRQAAERAAFETSQRIEAERRAASGAEARRRAEEEQRLAFEAEARRKAEDERRQQDEAVARQKAEQDARLAADEEARKKAEEEKRLAAEAEAKRKAEDARKAAAAAAVAAAAKRAAVEEQQRRAAAAEQQRRAAQEQQKRDSDNSPRQQRTQQSTQSGSGSSSCGTWRACRALYSTQPGTACGPRPSGC